jgi:hypothetical protein
MRRLVAASVAFVVLAAPAYAAKSAAKKTKPVPQAIAALAPIFTWTGCYVGGHIGGGCTRRNQRSQATHARNIPTMVIPLPILAKEMLSQVVSRPITARLTFALCPNE